MLKVKCVCAALAGLVLLAAALPAGDAVRLPTTAEVSELQKNYRAERDRLSKTGGAKMFHPDLLTRADEIAKRGDDALAGNRLLQAAQTFREARWQLPYLPAEFPAHVGRVFGNLRLRHTQEVQSASYSPDGSLLATGGRDRLVRVWDLANGSQLRAYAKHDEAVRAVAFSPDGKAVASGGGKDVRLWDPKTGADLRTFAGRGRYVTSLAFSPDGKYLAVASDDQALRLYDAANGKVLREFADFKQMVESLAFSPDGLLLLAGAGDGQLRLYVVPRIVKEMNQVEAWSSQENTTSSHHVAFSPDGKSFVRCGPDAIKLYSVSVPANQESVNVANHRLPTLEAPQTPAKDGNKNKVQWFTCAAFSKDNRTLFTGGTDSFVRLWDLDTGLPTGTFKGHNDEIRALVFNAQGSQLASASSDFTLRLWNFDIVAQSREYPGHTLEVWTAAFGPDNSRVVTASSDGTAKVWDLVGGKAIHTLTHKGPVTWAEFSPDGKVIATAGGDKALRLWNADTGAALRACEGHTATVTCLAFDAKGVRVATGGADKNVKVWDATGGKELYGIPTRAIVTSVAFSPDDKVLAVASVDQAIRLYDAANGKPITEWIAHNGAANCVTFSRDGKWLASCGADQLVKLWKTEKPGVAPVVLTGHTGPLSTVAFRGDNNYLVSGGSDQTIKLWHITPDGVREAQNFRGHRDWISSVTFSRDGTYVASGACDRTFRVWEITSREIPLLSEHTGAVVATAVSPDGKLIASAGTDRIIKLWNPATGVEVQSFTGHAMKVVALAFTPDGKTLVSTSEDRSIRLWDVKAGKEVPRHDGHTGSFHNLLSSVTTLAFTPDSQRMAVWLPESERYTKIGLYELENGREVATFNDVGRHASAVAFTHDAKVAAIGAHDGTVRLYDVEKKEAILLAGKKDWPVIEKGSVGSLAFTPDGKTLLVGTAAGEVRVFDVAKRQQLHAVKGHGERVHFCTVSKDGSRFATAGVDSVIKVWETAKARELRSWDLRQPADEVNPFVGSLAFTPDGTRLVSANGNTTLYALELP